MKRCPECYEVYENSEQFCELDGRRLLFDPALSADVVETLPPGNDGLHLKRESLATGLIGLMVGIILCLGAYALWTLQADSREQETPAYASRMREPAPVRAAPAQIPEPKPVSTESPAPETEPVSELPPESTASAETKTVEAHLNQGPVSTGRPIKERYRDDGAGIQTVIEMTDGSALEVDAAWEDSQGVWYRRGGLVSFLESRRVKAILARTEAKPSPASNQ